MLVAVVGVRGIPDVMGGIESHCAQLLPRLVRKAAYGQIKVVVLARRPYVPSAGGVDGVQQIPLWAPGHPVLETIIHTIYAVLYARFSLRADCVYLHAIGPGLTAPLAKLLGMSIIFTHHGEDFRRKKWGRVARSALRLGEYFAVACADRVITVSSSTAERLKKSYPHKANQISHIPNGMPAVAPESSIDGLSSDLEVEPGQYIVSVGRLVPEKAQDLLIQAYRRTDLARRNPPCKLMIIGAADHQSDYAKQVIAQTGDGVVLAGAQSRDIVMTANRNAALFVLPSYHEGLSVAALEAIRAGTPVLLSDIRANADIGLPERNYFSTGSVLDLAEKLQAPFETYAVPTDFDMRAYDWDQIARQTLDQFATLPRSRHPHPSGEICEIFGRLPACIPVRRNAF